MFCAWSFRASALKESSQGQLYIKCLFLQYNLKSKNNFSISAHIGSTMYTDTDISVIGQYLPTDTSVGL